MAKHNYFLVNTEELAASEQSSFRTKEKVL
jgi:hypothetical protein